MPEVIFIPVEGDRLVVLAPEGGSLGDLCDEVDAPVPFSCRGATCGTCRVVVLEGEALLLPPNEDEVSLLALFGSPPGHRLACQAVMHPGGGRLVVRPVMDSE
jgi:ferredoxin